MQTGCPVPEPDKVLDWYRTYIDIYILPRLGEALWPWPELKSAFLGVARQTRVIRMAVASVASVCDLGNQPNQPASFNFPKWKFGLSKPVFWSVQPAWFNKWPWLHYDQVEHKMFC